MGSICLNLKKAKSQNTSGLKIYFLHLLKNWILQNKNILNVIILWDWINSFSINIRSFVKIFTCTICPDFPSFCAERIFCPLDLEKMLWLTLNLKHSWNLAQRRSQLLCSWSQSKEETFFLLLWSGEWMIWTEQLQCQVQPEK